MNAESPAAPRRSRLPILLGVGVVALAVAGIFAWSKSALEARLQDAANEMFAKTPLDSPEAIAAATTGNLQFNADLLPLFKDETVASIASQVAKDSSPQRRAAAACLLTRWMNLERARRPGAAAALATLSAVDPNPTVRTVAAHSARYWHETAEDSKAVVEAIAALTPAQQVLGAEAILKMRKIPDSAAKILGGFAESGPPAQRFQALNVLAPTLGKEKVAALMDAALAAIDAKTLDEASHEQVTAAIRKYAPERLAGYLEKAPTVPMLITAAATRFDDPALAKTVTDAAVRTLGESNADLYFVSAKALLVQTGGTARLVGVLKDATPEHRKKIMAAAGDPGQLRAEGRGSTSAPNAADLAAVADLFASPAQDAAAFVAAALVAGQGNRDAAELPWTPADRAKLRARVASEPAYGAAWTLAVATTLGAKPTAEDLAVFEKFLDETIAKGGGEPPAAGRRGRASLGKYLKRYWDAAGEKRAGEHLVGAFRRGADHSAVGDILDVLAQKPALLDRVADEVVKRAADAKAPREKSAVYRVPACRLLLAKPRTLPDDVWKNLWVGWLDALTDAPPTLAQARKLVPPAAALGGLQQYVRESLPTEQAPKRIAKVRSLPDYNAAYASAVREMAADKDANVRRTTATAVAEFKPEPAVASEVLLKLANDQDAAVVSAAFNAFDRLPAVPRPAELAVRIRQLAGPETPAKLRALGIFYLAELPDRNDADLKIVEASAGDSNDRVQAAVKFAQRNWMDGKKKLK